MALSTYTIVSLTRMRVNMTLTSVISTRSVLSTSTNVIPTRTRLISTRRLRFPHAECDFTRRMLFLLTRDHESNFDAYASKAECKFHTHSDFDTHECDNDTHNCDVNTQSVILTLTSVIYTRRV
jgi:hypothetical protein